MASEGRTIGIAGGGRWGRTHVRVLYSLLTDRDSVVWFTRHNEAINRRWLAVENYTRVRIVTDEAELWAQPLVALVVATATPTHSTWVEKSLLRHIPVLSEKPITLDSSKADQLLDLSKQQQISIGVNLEFTYASYINDLVRALNDISIGCIHVTWHDPATEVRDNEVKTTDILTPPMHDALSHVWSLLNKLTDVSKLEIIEVNHVEDKSVLVTARTPIVPQILISTSRDANQRQRIIAVNDGEVILDFHPEPGNLIINGLSQSLVWSGLRPMGASVSAFLNHIMAGTDYPTSLEKTLGAVIFSEAAQRLLDSQL